MTTTDRRRFLTGAAATAGAGAAMLGAGIAAAPGAGATPPGATEFALNLKLLDLTASPAPTLTPVGVDGSGGWIVKGIAARSGDIVYLTVRVLFGDTMTTPGILAIDSADLDADFAPRTPGLDILPYGGQNFPVGVGFVNDDTKSSVYADPAQPTSWPLWGGWVRTDNLPVSSPLLGFMPMRPQNLANGQSWVGMDDVPFEDPLEEGTILFFSGTYLWAGEPPE